MNVKLLRRVAKHILAEPKRLNMGTWIDHGDPEEDKALPKCGTIGCIAGWTCLLVHGMKWDGPDVMGEAQRLLKISDEQAEFLFLNKMTLGGTKRDAMTAAKHIEKFIKTGE